GHGIRADTIPGPRERACPTGAFSPFGRVCAPRRRGLEPRRGVPPAGSPPPAEHELPAVTNLDGSPAEPLSCDPKGPLVAEVVKTTIDPYVGRVSLVRVFSGTLTPETAAHIAGHGLAERGHADHDPDPRTTHPHSP